MRHFARRRLIGTVALLLLCAVAWLAISMLELSLRPAAFWSGWLLLAIVFGLSAFNARKKLPFLQLQSATAWMEIHAYAGLFCVFMYVLHTGLEIPNGPLERVLALLFALVSLSGIGGLVLTRLLPPRLAATPDLVIFERIPIARRELRERVEQLAVRASNEFGSSLVGDFYADRLFGFFRQPRNQLFHLVDSKQPLRQLEAELDSIGRYASAAERTILSEISECVRSKDALDYQHAQQAALKGWLFVHIPLTWALLVTLVPHVVLVHAFRGGAGL